MNVGRIGYALPTAGVDSTRPASPPRSSETAFDRLLEYAERAVEPANESAETNPAESRSLQFSRHAAARLRSRGIELSADDLAEIGLAVDRLAERNANESLLLVGENAFIVGVPKRTVITAMTRGEAVGSIFTNIDSTLVLR